jgi:hypothetical protein
MSNFKTITITVVPRLITEVRVYEETIAHASEHAEIPKELPCIIEAVEGALKAPTHIEVSPHPSSYVFVDATTTNRSGDPLRVPVKVVDGTSARMKTFFFGKPNYAPTVIWERSDDE